MAALRMLFLAFLVALGAPLSRADELPACTAASAGIVACIAERLCRCTFQRGGSMVDREAGHRWDCGPLRPNCHRPPTTVQRQAPPFTSLDLVVPLREATPWPHRGAVPWPHREAIPWPHREAIPWPHREAIPWPHREAIPWPRPRPR